MDQHDLKSSGMANSLRHFHSLEGPDPVRKANSSSDSHEVVSDGGPGLDKQKHGSVADPEVNCCEYAQSAATESKYLNHDQFSPFCCSKENADESMLLSSVVSPSSSLELIKENFAEVTCGVMSGNGNLQDSVTSTSSPRGVDSSPNISMKSDVSMEGTRTLVRERDELVGRRMNEHWLDIDEDGSKLVIATCQSKQLKTESASSNSTPAFLPASSNDSCQETSVNAKSCEHNKHTDIDTCIYNDFECKSHESAVNISLSSVDAQNALKGRANLRGFSADKERHIGNPLKTPVGTRCDEVVGMIKDSNLAIAGKIELQKSNLPVKENADFLEVKPCFELNDVLEVVQRVARDVGPEGGTYKGVSGRCSSVQDQSGETVHTSSVDSAVSDKGGSIQTGSKVHFGYEQGRCDGFCSRKDQFDPYLSNRSLDAKETSTNRDHMRKHKDDGLHGQISSPFTIKSEYITSSDKPNCASRFDLNENILVDEVDYQKLSTKGTSFHAEAVSKPIPMVAKSGLSIGLPKSRMQLDEAGGWRGSAATSAFRPTSFPQCISRTKASSLVDDSKSSECSQVNGFDLNIAAEGGDCDMELLQEKCLQPVSSFPFEESSLGFRSSRAEMSNIDLNCVSEDDNNGHPLCLPASSLRNSVKDFDLNHNPISANEYSDSHLSAQGTSMQKDRVVGDSVVTFLDNLKQPESNSVRSLYHADSSPMQSFSHGQARPFLMAAPAILPPNEQLRSVVTLQPRQTYASCPPPTSLPSHALLCNNAFFIDPNNCLSSSVYPPGVISYNITNPQVTSFFPQILGSGAPSAVFETPYIMHGPGGLSSSNIAMVRRASFDPNGGVALSENGSKGGNGRPLSAHVNNTTKDQMRSFQQLALSTTPTKRREPDGGWDSHQLGLRQMTS